jgi:hypothetical protein
MSYHVVDDNGRTLGCSNTLGALPTRPAWGAPPRTRVLPRGRQVMETGSSYGLGFSLKPPKWVRKAQPGKILKKIALPAAAVGAALLIPGVGGAIVGGISAAARASGSVLSKLVSVVRKVPSPVPALRAAPAILNSPVAQTISTALSPASVMPASSPSMPTPISMSPMTDAPQQYASSSFAPAQASASDQAAGTSSGEMPPWLIPAGIAAAALVLMSNRRS